MASASVLFANDTQVNVRVPAAVSGKSSTQVMVSVDGVASAAFRAQVSVAAPAIFPGGVLNQDGSVNGAASAAAAGSVLQIFATGLPAGGPISAKIHDRAIVTPLFAGEAPTAPGVQQVNAVIPPDLPAMQTYVYVCSGETCSPAVKLWIR